MEITLCEIFCRISWHKISIVCHYMERRISYSYNTPGHFAAMPQQLAILFGDHFFIGHVNVDLHDQFDGHKLIGG
jgi:hypothetical protein